MIDPLRLNKSAFPAAARQADASHQAAAAHRKLQERQNLEQLTQERELQNLEQLAQGRLRTASADRVARNEDLQRAERERLSIAEMRRMQSRELKSVTHEVLSLKFKAGFVGAGPFACLVLCGPSAWFVQSK